MIQRKAIKCAFTEDQDSENENANLLPKMKKAMSSNQLMNMEPGPGSPYPRQGDFPGEKDNLSEKSQEIPKAASLYFEE